MLFESIISREPIEKGWSADQKYRARLKDGGTVLLRISPVERYERVCRSGFQMQELERIGVRLCSALEWGICAEGAYAIHRWVDGWDAEHRISRMTEKEQYAFGLEAGRQLRLIHTSKPAADIPLWEQRYGSKIDRKLDAYGNCAVQYEDGECMVRYIRENRHLMEGRVQCYQHGDYHIGNMMINKNGELVIIDFEKDDFGDPWEEFNRIVWSVQESERFASGIIDGYFSGNVPPKFWELLALYICTNSIGSLPWAIPYGKQEVETMRRQQREIISWYDHMGRVIPSWYHTGQ